MFRIAICDDQPRELEKVCTQTEKWLNLHRAVEGKIDSFHTADELKKTVRKRPWEYDLYILDIMMRGENGIQFGNWVRQYNRDALMIYVTSSRDYALEAFDNHAIHYLLKPLDEVRFQTAMDMAYRLYQTRPKHVIAIQTKDGISSIVMEEIMYIENNLKSITYTLRNGERIILGRRQGSFEEAAGCVAESEDFIQPHKSFFVNLRYIASLQENTVLMDDGKTIPISRRRVAETQSRYIQYISGGG